MSETAKTPVTLTANQIAWCRKNIRAFSEAWRDVQNADAHKAKVYERMGVEPGGVGVPSEPSAVAEAEIARQERGRP